ncbi:MAG TPA: rod shape-determining protein MreD [Limnobacter sp.]|uniref:rod shape-determining protein MreD n=1 Tax=Limnobacter sp. TaxID=2003368 RepID=UPI002ED7A7CD
MGLNAANSPEILRPVNPWFMALSLFVAMLLRFIPVDRDWLMPDFLALVLVFWNIRQPRRIGIGAAWCFGAIMDVHSSSVFGEHALAYTLLSYFAITIHRRVMWFSPLMQAAHILPLLLAAQAVTVVIRVLFGANFPGMWIFAESFLTAALWPLTQFVLIAPQKLPMNRDEDRPI